MSFLKEGLNVETLMREGTSNPSLSEEDGFFSFLKKPLRDVLKFLEQPEVDLGERPGLPPCSLLERENLKKKDNIKTSAALKNQKEIGNYFSCYQKNDKFTDRYKKQIKEDIAKVVEHYSKMIPAYLRPFDNDAQTLFSCLIFRESAGWKNVMSHTGARGIGQFTFIAVENLKKMLSSEYKSDAEIDAKIEEFEQLLEKSSSQERKDFYRENIVYLENKKKLNERIRAMQNYWNELKLPDKPAIEDINLNYIFDLANSEIILHLSMLMIIDCQISYSQEKIQHLQSNTHNSFFACTGAYNMGKWGFYENVLKGAEGDEIPKDWLSNLKNTRSQSKEEIKHHLISIHRCAQKKNNFPMCGTENDYCEDELPFSNICKQQEELLKCHDQECP